MKLILIFNLNIMMYQGPYIEWIEEQQEQCNAQVWEHKYWDKLIKAADVVIGDASKIIEEIVPGSIE